MDRDYNTATETETSPSLKAARRYWGFALPPVPIEPSSKQPPVGLSWKELQNKLQTRKTVEKFWSADRWQNAGVGIILGCQDPRAVPLFSVDCDSADGANWLAKQGLTPSTHNGPIVKTVKGHRYYFKIPKGYQLGHQEPVKGVELRGTGCLDVMPPSLHPNGTPYEWVEGHPLKAPIPTPTDWLLELLDRDHDHDHTENADTPEDHNENTNGTTRKPKQKTQPSKHKQLKLEFDYSKPRQYTKDNPSPHWRHLWHPSRRVATRYRNKAAYKVAAEAWHYKYTEPEARHLLRTFRRDHTQPGPGNDGRPFTNRETDAIVHNVYRSTEAEPPGILHYSSMEVEDSDGLTMSQAVAVTVYGSMPKAYTPRPISDYLKKPILWTVKNIIKYLVNETDPRQKHDNNTAKELAEHTGGSKATIQNVIYPGLKRKGLARTVNTENGRTTQINKQRLAAIPLHNILRLFVQPPTIDRFEKRFAAVCFHAHNLLKSLLKPVDVIKTVLQAFDGKVIKKTLKTPDPIRGPPGKSIEQMIRERAEIARGKALHNVT